MIKEDLAMTDSGVAGTGDPRLSPSQRDIAVNKYNKKKMREVFRRKKDIGTRERSS